MDRKTAKVLGTLRADLALANRWRFALGGGFILAVAKAHSLGEAIAWIGNLRRELRPLPLP